jgi:hypothetical protein
MMIPLVSSIPAPLYGKIAKNSAAKELEKNAGRKISSGLMKNSY